MTGTTLTDQLLDAVRERIGDFDVEQPKAGGYSRIRQHGVTIAYVNAENKKGIRLDSPKHGVRVQVTADNIAEAADEVEKIAGRVEKMNGASGKVDPAQAPEPVEVLAAPEPANDGPAVTPNSVVVRDGAKREAKPDPKPTRMSDDERKRRERERKAAARAKAKAKAGK